MPKQLNFSWENQTVAFDMEKVDRMKLYGIKSLEVVDADGGRCRIVTRNRSRSWFEEPNVAQLSKLLA